MLYQKYCNIKGYDLKKVEYINNQINLKISNKSNHLDLWIDENVSHN